MLISSAVRLLVMLAIMPHNHFFSMGNQTILLLSHILSAIEPLINLFSLVPVPCISAGKFVLFDHKAALIFSPLLLFPNMQQKYSVFLCATNSMAVNHQDEFVSD
jgi:hypothetical protein